MPAYQEGDYTVRDFKFHTGEVMAALKVHYTTLGNPENEAVLHGTAGSGTGMLNPAFAGELFGPGQPLNVSKTLQPRPMPSALVKVKSTKPSDGLRAKFPRYNYDDMVDA